MSFSRMGFRNWNLLKLCRIKPPALGPLLVVTILLFLHQFLLLTGSKSLVFQVVRATHFCNISSCIGSCSVSKTYLRWKSPYAFNPVLSMTSWRSGTIYLVHNAHRRGSKTCTQHQPWDINVKFTEFGFKIRARIFRSRSRRQHIRNISSTWNVELLNVPKVERKELWFLRYASRLTVMGWTIKQLPLNAANWRSCISAERSTYFKMQEVYHSSYYLRKLSMWVSLPLERRRPDVWRKSKVSFIYIDMYIL